MLEKLSVGQFPFKIDQAGPTDAEDAFGLIDEYYAEIGVLIRDNRADLEHYLADPQSGIWLARRAEISDAAQQGIAAGCIVLRPLPHISAAGEIKRMYVRKAYRGNGVAKALLAALEIHARERAMRWLYLDTKDDLHAAIRLYELSGYRHCERYNDNSQATIFMRKRLVRSS